MKLKIRASSLGKIMTSDNASTITEKQSIELDRLLGLIKLTETQAKLRDKLELKRNAPPTLSTGAKTYVKELFMYHEFGVRQEINSKYLDKGNEVEDLAIELAGIYLDQPDLVKNDEYFENEFLTGTPDVCNDEVLIDVKSSWSAATFPFFDAELKNSLYEWQLKAYMWLTGHTEGYLVYCLVPTPEDLILDEMRRVSWKRGELGEVSIETEAEVRVYFDISKIPTDKRVKSFKVELTKKDVADMKEKVYLARNYYKQIKQR